MELLKAAVSVGRVVHFVMMAGQVRPLIVVDKSDDGQMVNGVLFFDGANDRDVENFPPNVVHETDSGVKMPCVAHVQSAAYSLDDEPGTWHWPPVAKSLAQAGESAAQGAVLTVEHLESRFKDMLLGLVNSKLNTHVEAVGKLLDDHTEFVKSTVAAVGGTSPAPAAEAEPIPGGLAAEGGSGQAGEQSGAGQTEKADSGTAGA